MKKYIFYHTTILAVVFYSYSVTHEELEVSLEHKAFNAYFNSKTWSERKSVFNQFLVEEKINTSILFTDKTFNNLDFSYLCFRNQVFTECTFENIKFNGSDLRNVQFYQCQFINCSFIGALLYYPGEGSIEDIRKKGFKVPTIDSYELVKLYSNLMQQYDKHEYPLLLEQALCLNKLFPSLKLELRDKNLKCFNLNHINLRNAKLSKVHLEDADLTDADLQDAKLEGAHLEGAWITKEVQVPHYTEKNKRELFNRWINGIPEEQAFYQILVNGGFDLFNGVDYATLCAGLKLKKDLRNLNLSWSNLEEIELAGANLQGANLLGANLKGADLTNTNLQGANLLGAKLSEADLTGANLQSVSLQYAWLDKANLTDANLQGANLIGSHLQGANFLRKSLKEANLIHSNFEELFF